MGNDQEICHKIHLLLPPSSTPAQATEQQTQPTVNQIVVGLQEFRDLAQDYPILTAHTERVDAMLSVQGHAHRIGADIAQVGRGRSMYTLCGSNNPFDATKQSVVPIQRPSARVKTSKTTLQISSPAPSATTTKNQCNSSLGG